MKKMRYIIIAMLLALTIIPIEARDIRDVWIDMPDSLSAYLNKDMRKKMINLAAMDTSVYTENMFKGLSRIDSIADNYLSAKMSDSHRLEMITTINPKGDSCIVVLSTYTANNMQETSVLLYDMDWNQTKKCQLSPELCKISAEESAPDDKTIVVTVSARFDGRDTLTLTPSIFSKKEGLNFTQNKVKIVDLIFK